MEFTTLQAALAIIFTLSVVALYTYFNGLRRDPNKSFTFEVTNTRGVIIVKACNAVRSELGFEAHFYPTKREQVEEFVKSIDGEELEIFAFREGRQRPTYAKPHMQQYFGKRVYTFRGVNTDSHYLDINLLGEQIIDMCLQQQLTMSEDRVKFDMGLLRDLLFGFEYEEMQLASQVYSPEMFNSIVSASKEFSKVNALSYKIQSDSVQPKVSYKWLQQPA